MLFKNYSKGITYLNTNFKMIIIRKIIEESMIKYWQAKLKFIKIIINHAQAVFILEIQEWFIILRSINAIDSINRLNDRNHKAISINPEKAFYKRQNPFMIRFNQTLVMEKEYLSKIKALYTYIQTVNKYDHI